MITITHQKNLQKRIVAWVLWLAGVGLACNLTPGIPQPGTGSPASNTAASAGEFPTATITLTPETPTVLPSHERFLCEGQPTVVALLVDPGLANAVRTGLDQFESDLCADAYSVVERTLDFGSAPEVRAYLADLYKRTAQTLEGAIFIGSVPFVYQSIQAASSKQDATTPAQEVISFQYYSDLDGEFSASPGHRSPGQNEFSFDLHSGKVDWEIWTGILPFYRGEEAQTVDALNRYFEKNHRYRTGQYTIPEAFLLIGEHFTAKTADEQANLMNILRSGSYSWTPLSNSPTARIYFTGPTLSVEDGYDDLSAGAADITVTETHGDYTMSGRINIVWVESRPVRTILFWTDGCSVGNLDHPENFLTSIVYSTTSEVLVAKGSTNDSGGLGSNQEGFYGHNIAVRLVAGKNLGQAILGHVNVPLISPWAESREFHFSMLILLGDPTLRFRG
jgi:hypothetical protein